MSVCNKETITKITEASGSLVLRLHLNQNTKDLEWMV